MDIYLPADFHTLHDSVTTDWRDIAKPQSPQEATRFIATPAVDDNRDLHVVDPSWLAL